MKKVSGKSHLHVPLQVHGPVWFWNLILPKDVMWTLLYWLLLYCYDIILMFFRSERCCSFAGWPKGDSAMRRWRNPWDTIGVYPEVGCWQWRRPGQEDQLLLRGAGVMYCADIKICTLQYSTDTMLSSEFALMWRVCVQSLQFVV